VHVSARSAICKYMSWFTPMDRAMRCVTPSRQSAGVTESPTGPADRRTVGGLRMYAYLVSGSNLVTWFMSFVELV